MINEAHIKKLNRSRTRKNRMFGILCMLSILVSVAVFWQLRTVGITISDEASCGKTAHSHTEECIVEQKLRCNQEENTENVLQELVCQQDEHSHSEACFEEKKELVCELNEDVSVHIHNENCYLTEMVTTCSSDEHVHEETCRKEEIIESEGHVHNDECYSNAYSCGVEEEHTHEIMCYSDPGADVELQSEWEATIPNELTGVWTEDVIAVAKSQLGYMESEKNFILADDGETRQGYTRYGEWTGNPYGNWDAMFAAFCIHYAGIPEDAFPVATGGNAWKVKLNEQELYAEKESYLPKEGDLIFFDFDISDGADHVGIVVEVDEENEKIKTIEGNTDDCVQYATYELDDANILGYGILPENLDKSKVDEEVSSAQNVLGYAVMAASEAGGTITNTYSYDAIWDAENVMISDLIVTASCDKGNAYIRIEYSDDEGENWTTIVTSEKLNKANTSVELDAIEALKEAPLNRQIRVYSYDNNKKNYGYTASFGMYEILESVKSGFCDWLENNYVQNFNGTVPTTQSELYDAFAIYYELPDVTIETRMDNGNMIVDAKVTINGELAESSGYTYLWEYQTEDGIWKTLSESTGASLDTSSLDEEKLSMLNDGGKNVRCTLYEDGQFNAISNVLLVNPLRWIYDMAIEEINEGLDLGNLEIYGTRFNEYFYYGNVSKDESVPFNDSQSYADYLAKIYLDAGGGAAGLAEVKTAWDMYLYDLYDPAYDAGSLSNTNGGYPAEGSTYGDQNLGWPKDRNSSFHGNVQAVIEELNYDYLEDGVDYSNFVTGLKKTATAIRAGDENIDRKYDIDITADAQAKAKGPVVMVLQIQTSWQMFDLLHANALKGEGAKTEVGAASSNTELTNLYDIKHALLRFVDYMKEKYPGNNLVLGITEVQHGGSSSMLTGTDDNGKELYVSNSYDVLRSGLLNWDTFGNCEHVHYDTIALKSAVKNLESNLSGFKDVYGYEIAYEDIQKCAVIIGGPTENSSSANGYACTLPWEDFRSEELNSVYGIRTNNGTSLNDAGVISWLDYSGNVKGEAFNDGEGTTYTSKYVATNEDAIFNTLVQIAEQEMQKNGVDLEEKDVYVEDTIITDTVSDEFFIDYSEPITATVYNKEGAVQLEKVISIDDPNLQIINNDDGSTTITYNFGKVYNTQKCKLHFRVAAQEDYIGSNNVFSNEGTPELDYEHTSSRGTEEYSVNCYDTPQVNVPIRFVTVDGKTEDILVGESVDLADLSTEIAKNAEDLVDNYNQINGILSYTWVLPNGMEIDVGSVNVAEGNIGEQVFPDRTYLFEGTEAGQYTGTLKVTFSPEAVDSTNKNFSDANTAVAVNSLTNPGNVWINVLSADSTEEFLVRKEWVGTPPDGANIQFCLKSNGQIVLDENGEEIIWTLSEENNWETKIHGLPSIVDGVIQNYSVEEIDIPEGYSASYSTEAESDTAYSTRLVIKFTSTQNNDNAVLKITYQYNDETRTLTTDKVKLKKGETYTYEVDGLPTDEDGKSYTYNIVSIENTGKGAFGYSDEFIDAETYQSGMTVTEVKVITNGPSFVLPETGGSGTNLYTYSGLLLIALALMYGYILRRKQERRLEK